CPADALAGERVDDIYTPTLVGKCTSCGICYASCPRVQFYEYDLLGDFQSVWKARTKYTDHAGQDGGAVTAMLASGIKSKLIEAAIVVVGSKDHKWLPSAVVADSEDTILKSSGSFYTHTPIIEGLVKALRAGKKKLAAVGTACNIDAIHRMEADPAGILRLHKGAEVTKISLFCTKSYHYQRLSDFLKENGINIHDVERFAIAGGKLSAEAGGENYEWPVKELEELATKACDYCLDMSGVNADLSCGNVGSEDGWTTIIIRTDRGKKLFEKAVAEKKIEAEKIAPEEIRAVQKLAQFKVARKYK
ncbi:MAG: Coenzyme F420 hydrogenase/dehydrogenase, beta subunit C-terminal domain, partial [Candidatus Hodarchaeota archaeon]